MFVPASKQRLGHRAGQSIAGDVQGRQAGEPGETRGQTAFEVVERQTQSRHERAVGIAVDEVAHHAMPVAHRHRRAPALVVRPTLAAGAGKKLDEDLAFNRRHASGRLLSLRETTDENRDEQGWNEPHGASG